MFSVLNHFSINNAVWSSSDEKEGVLVLLAKKESSDELLNRIRKFEREDKGEDLTQEQQRKKKRTVGIGSQILADLGVHKMRLMSSGTQYTALGGYGLEIVEHITPNKSS